MKKEAFQAICKTHSPLILMDGDVEEALSFVAELLYEEARDLKANEPYAVNTIKRLEKACDEVNSLWWAIRDFVE